MSIMKTCYRLALLCAMFSVSAEADIYKYVDSEGHVTYSSSPMKGAKKLEFDTSPSSSETVSSSRSRSESTVSDFPRINEETQRSRDDTRRKILEEELANEAKLLAEARQNLKEGKENPETYKGKDGHTYRNVAKYQEKVSQLEQEVVMHEKNIDALRAELANLK